MKNIKVVVFDCDGVMFDSVKANTDFYNHILIHFGWPVMTPEQFEYANMHTAEKVLTYLFEDPDMLESALAYRSRMSYRPFVGKMEIEPYLKPLLHAIRPFYKTAVATNRADSMDWVISDHGLEGLFDLVINALDVNFPKPDPEPLQKILSYFQITPQEALFVGDSQLDEIAARRAGVPLVAYNNQALQAAYHISSLKELESMLING